MTEIAPKQYARAIMALELSEQEQQAFEDELWVSLKLYHEKRDFRDILLSPNMSLVDKKIWLEKTFSSAFARFLTILIEQDDLAKVKHIIKDIEILKSSERGLEKAFVTSASPLSEESRSLLVQKLESRTNKKIELIEHVDSKVVGGLRVKIGDDVIDGTVFL